MKLLLIFISLNIVNVILQTVKSICTIKCGKISAALINAIAFGLYTVVLVYTNCELSTATKALVVAGCNFIGVYAVKVIEEKMKKDRLWKIEFTTKLDKKEITELNAKSAELSYNCIQVSDEYIQFNFYCKTQEETQKAHNIVKTVGGKYFITETKNF